MNRSEILSESEILPWTGCIIWPLAHTSDGYGQTSVGGKVVYVHRIVAGAGSGDVVRHTCDEPSCVNPDHLVVGTYKENTQDAVRKGRMTGPRGGANSHAKLTQDDVKKIRRLKKKTTLSCRAIGELFGVGRHAVNDIVLGKNWRWLK